MLPRIKDTLFVAAIAVFLLLQVQSLINLLIGPPMPWFSLIQPIGRLIPLVIVLALAYLSWRIWIGLKALVRRWLYRVINK